MGEGGQDVNTITLPDGRRLAWREYGAPDGVPCVYLTGTPASGLAGALYDAEAAAHAVRWISVDKPGYGQSDFHDGRRLLDTPDDIRVLADHLSLDRFAVAGESGGGPHALAVGYAMPERLTTVVLLAGLGPAEHAWVRKGMKRQNRLLLLIAQRAPWAMLPMMKPMARVLDDPDKAAKYFRKQIATSPPADQKVLGDPQHFDVFLAATRDAFRDGPRGTAQEMAMFARPWGFQPSDVRVRVDMWHGTEDRNVPVAIANAVASQLPDVTPHIIDGAGHSVAWTALPEIMATVRAAASAHDGQR